MKPQRWNETGATLTTVLLRLQMRGPLPRLEQRSSLLAAGFLQFENFDG